MNFSVKKYKTNSKTDAQINQAVSVKAQVSSNCWCTPIATNKEAKPRLSRMPPGTNISRQANKMAKTIHVSKNKIYSTEYSCIKAFYIGDHLRLII
jgi:hypothetical protein